MPPNQGLKHFSTLFICFFISIKLSAQSDFTISGDHIIPAGTTEEYNNLYLDDNNSNLIVNGTLIVHGNLIMSGNKSQFTMGDSAFVLIYGNFESSNLVNISVSSYLIIQGDFSRISGSDQAELDLTNANVYILGEVEGWPTDFTTCDDYDGTTDNSSTEDCDFGSEDDLEANIDTFPPEFRDKLNCYNMEGPKNISVCIGGTATFSVTSSNTDVIYNWQYKTPEDSEYSDIGTNSSSLNLSGITLGMSGNLYRVVLKATDDTAPGCKMTISDPATLEVTTINEWTGNVDTNWNTAGNWLCNSIPALNSDIRIPAGLTNYPILNAGSTGQCRDIIIENMASVTVMDNTLEISGSIFNTGNFDVTDAGVEMLGNISQIIPNSAFLNNRIKNLSINNAAGVSLSGDLEITGILNVLQGNLNSNGFLTLISDASQTALIDGSGSGAISGNVTMQRFIDPAFGYKYISSPFSNSIVGDLEAYVNLDSAFPLFYKYDENREDSEGNDATGWVAYTSQASALEVMKGYAINMGNSPTPATVELTGLVNNSDYNLTLANNDGTYTKGFHLVGNPYPSPIDWNAASGWTRYGIDAATYLFSADNSDQFTGTYSSYVNDISSAGTGSGIIASMQGFFVHVTSPTGGTLGMTNSVRINDFTNHDFIKSKESSTPLVRISAGFENEELDDPMVIYFDSFASLDFEAEKDALKLMNTNKDVPNLYSVSADEKDLLSINAVPGPVKKSYKRIRLGLKTEREGNIRFSLKDLENISGSLNVFLIDQQRQTAKNLKKGDYQVSIGKGQFNSRFFLSFSSSEYLDPSQIKDSPFNLISGHHKIGVKMNLMEGKKGTLRINSINGKLIKLLNVQANEEITIDGIKSNGLYLVTFISGNEQYTKKVIVKK